MLEEPSHLTVERTSALPLVNRPERTVYAEPVPLGR